MTATETAPASALPALTVEQLFDQKSAPERDIAICLDGGRRMVLAQADQRVRQARFDLDQAIQTAKDRLSDAPEALREALDDTTEIRRCRTEADDAESARAAALEVCKLHSVTMRFRGIGKHEYDELVSRCQPTQKQLKDAAEAKPPRPKPMHDGDKYPPLLVAACCVNPQMTEEQAQKLWDDPNWNGTDLLQLYYAAQDVCSVGAEIDLGNA